MQLKKKKKINANINAQKKHFLMKFLGESGLKNLEHFLKHKLKYFNSDRNNPNKDALSDMSPWYHFGKIFYFIFVNF